MDLLIGVLAGLLGLSDLHKNYKKSNSKKLEIGQRTDIVEDYFTAIFLLLFSVLLMSGKFSLINLFM